MQMSTNGLIICTQKQSTIESFFYIYLLICITFFIMYKVRQSSETVLGKNIKLANRIDFLVLESFIIAIIVAI